MSGWSRGFKVFSLMVLVSATSSALALDVPIVPSDSVNGAVKPADQGSEASSKDKDKDKSEPENTGKVKTLSRVSDEVKNQPGISADQQKRISGGEMTFEGSRQELQVREGVNVGVEVSRGHLNRIVTPYPNPRVMKVNKEVVTKIKGRVIYVATRDESPVTMFVRNEGDEGDALSLTLIPRGIPPKEIRLSIPGVEFAQRGDVDRAHSWELKNGYMKSIRSLMRNVAKGEIPPGYSMRGINANDVAPRCAQSGIKFDFSRGQVVKGSRFKLIAGVATNVKRSKTEILEKNCGARGVKAVALWPTPLLKPGQQAEVYVVMDRDSGRPDPSRTRPSLIKGGVE